MAKKKANTAKVSTPKTNGANSNGARLTRGRSMINTIKAQLTKGATVVEHSVRCTLKHPAQPKGVVVACFARKDHVVALLPTLGARLKLTETDRNGTPFAILNTKEEAIALGKRIATALK